MKRPEPAGPITMDVIRHACALIQGVRTGRPEAHLEVMSEWARVEPEGLAALVVVLACMAHEDSARPELLFELLLDSGLDLTSVWRQAHRAHDRHRAEGRKPPAWVTAGEQIWQRLRQQRYRATRRQGAA